LANNPNLDRDLSLKVLENVDVIEQAVKIREVAKLMWEKASGLRGLSHGSGDVVYKDISAKYLRLVRQKLEQIIAHPGCCFECCIVGIFFGGIDANTANVAVFEFDGVISQESRVFF